MPERAARRSLVTSAPYRNSKCHGAPDVSFPFKCFLPLIDAGRLQADLFEQETGCVRYRPVTLA